MKSGISRHLLVAALFATVTTPALAQVAQGSSGEGLLPPLLLLLIGAVIWYLAKRGRAAKGQAATSQATIDQAARPSMKLTRSHLIIGVMGVIIVGLLISNQSGPSHSQGGGGRDAPPLLRLEDVHRAVTGARWANVNCGPVERNRQGQFSARCSLSGGVGPANFVTLVYTNLGWQEQSR